MRDDGAAIDPDIVQAAIAWLFRVQNDSTLWPACEAWQREHADHARAWQRVAKLDVELDADIRRLPADGEHVAQTLDRATSQLRRRRHLLKLFSLAFVGVGAAWFVHDVAHEQSW